MHSLYSAINRNEYLRAWSYFQSGAAPAYAAFKSGYSNTEKVELRLGKAKSEGAAGSVQTKLPVAIRTHQSDGSSKVFEGCYTLIQVDPSVQDMPLFHPIQISEAHLTPSSDAFSSVNPACN
ncbi:hypothetical protein [Ruegeria lacuscaerulensis]|uniref:hypothetical protein n=1 Tax=Ruegeria lacuscaerulensis TaxID=55218 RepID=UPI00147A3968|nr:hypothetical protein [Ruegeria lacuscaerulensis]